MNRVGGRSVDVAAKAGARAKPRPEEPRLKALVEELSGLGCEVECGGAKPFKGLNGHSMRAELWELWGISRDARSKWLNFNPNDRAYTRSMDSVAQTVLRALSGERHEGPPRSDDPVELGRLPAEITNGRLRTLVQGLWKDAESLGEAVASLKATNERRRKEYLHVEPAVFPRHVSDLLGDDGQPLEVGLASAPLSTAAKRNLFLKPLNWANVAVDAYAERPILRRRVLPDFRAFLNKVPEARSVFKLPVFWIGGRSGDGKSVLLLQLCQTLLREHCGAHFARFATADRLMQWLESHVASLGLLTEPLILVVDDLHKATDWSRAMELLELCATAQTHIAIATCGPSPERSLFLQDTETTLQVTQSDLTPLGDEDCAALARHLDIEIAPANSKRATLVERLFLSLPGMNARSLEAFANSLKARIEARVDGSNLLEQLTAMTCLDLGLPDHFVGAADAEWLDELAAETQLHVDHDDGYRFGHPAIAAPLFEVLTNSREHPRPFEARLASVLDPILASMPSVASVVRVLRQISARMPSTGLGDSKDVLRRLQEHAQDPVIANAISVAIIRQMNREGVALGRQWRALGRTLRDRRQTPPEARAHLARQLAAATDAEDADFLAALKLVQEVEVRPYMGPFLRSLVAGKARQRGWTFRGMPAALEWCGSHTESFVAQDLLFSYLAQYPRDTRIRAQAVQFVRDAPLARLKQHSVSVTAKWLEDELSDEIAQWLALNRESSAGAAVLATLLAKPGNRWQAEGALILSSVSEDAAALPKLLEQVAPHLDFDSRLEAVITRTARKLAQDPETSFFRCLAQLRGDFSVNHLLADRIRLLWSKNDESDVSSDGVELVALCWERLAGEMPETPGYVTWMFQRLSSLELATHDRGPSRTERTLANALESIVGHASAVEFYLRPAIRYFDEVKEGALRGYIAARLLRFEHDFGAPETELGQLVRARIAEATEVCWAHAMPKDSQPTRAQGVCAIAIVRTCWNSDADGVRRLVKSYWEPLPRFGAAQILRSWLHVDESRREAWDVLLHQQIRTERHDRQPASVVARSLDMAFEAINEGELGAAESGYLHFLLSLGVGDHETNPGSGWAALQRRDQWPDSAQRYLWRGVLQSALEGHTMTRDLYWEAFQAWQAVHRDPDCDALLRINGA